MKQQTSLIAFLAIILSSHSLASDVDPSQLEHQKRTPQGLYLSAREAYQLKQAKGDKALFIDVRTQSELEFVGAATTMDINIPYELNDFSQWDETKSRFRKPANSAFTLGVEAAIKSRQMGKTTPLILMCRAGKRSAKAAKLLSQAGYQYVYTVVDGFEGNMAKTGSHKGQRSVDGWKNAGLPWSYKLVKETMYFE